MADSGKTPSSNPLENFSNPTNPYLLKTFDNPGTVLVTDFLTTENYAIWSRSMLRALRAKNKLGFVNGTIPKPAATKTVLVDA